MELFDLPEDQRWEKTNELLIRFCLTKHNGFISRLDGGSEEDVVEHVGRAMASGINKADIQFKAYCAIMRQKREQGQYQRVIYLEPLLSATEKASLSLLPLGLLCVLLRKPIPPLYLPKLLAD